MIGFNRSIKNRILLLVVLLTKGVSAYTFADEQSTLWHSLRLSVSERESAYV